MLEALLMFFFFSGFSLKTHSVFGGFILFAIFIHFSKVDPLYVSFNLVVFSLYFLKILSSSLSAVLVLDFSEMLVLWLLLLLCTDP